MLEIGVAFSFAWAVRFFVQSTGGASVRHAVRFFVQSPRDPFVPTLNTRGVRGVGLDSENQSLEVVHFIVHQPLWEYSKK